MSNDERLDEVLRKLEESPESVSKAFGKTSPVKFTEVNQPTERKPERKKPSGKAPKYAPKMRPYPNVYLVGSGGEPIEWVGMFFDEDTAESWIARNGGYEKFVIENEARRDLPAWRREKK